MKVYLSGPLLGCSATECMEWRGYVKRKLSDSDIEFLDPTSREYNWKDPNVGKMVVEADKKDISECHLVLVNYTKPSVGTSMEQLYAYDLEIPIVTIIPKGLEVSPWLTYHTTRIVHYLDDAIEVIGRMVDLVDDDDS